jgi:hypothetical protein
VFLDHYDYTAHVERPIKAEQNGCRQRLGWHLSWHRRFSRFKKMIAAGSARVGLDIEAQVLHEASS